jgi:hypothetical protein
MSQMSLWYAMQQYGTEPHGRRIKGDATQIIAGLGLCVTISTFQCLQRHSIPVIMYIAYPDLPVMHESGVDTMQIAPPR